MQVEQWLKLLDEGARALGIVLGPYEHQKFQQFAALLENWNKKINLVRFQDKSELARAHFLDSLWCAVDACWEGSLRVMDVGSGAGFPGVPLKICFPLLKLYLLDSQHKRCVFLRELIRVLELQNCIVLPLRAEEVGHDVQFRETFDRVVVRALARLPVVLELSLPFLRLGGLLVALKGRDAEGEVRESRRALELLGGEAIKVMRYRLSDGDERHVVIVQKARFTPIRYPRRCGVPACRPLL